MIGGGYSTGPIYPSTGLGNIGNVFGPANAPSRSAPAVGFNPATAGLTGNPAQPSYGFLGNFMRPPVNPNPGGGMMHIMPYGGRGDMQPPSAQPNFLSQLHPHVMPMLRALPPEALQSLRGLIHPGLMNHLMSQR